MRVVFGACFNIGVFSVLTTLPHPESLSRWERETAFVRVQLLESPGALCRRPIARQTADDSPSPAGEGRASGSEQPTARRGEGEPLNHLPPSASLKMLSQY